MAFIPIRRQRISQPNGDGIDWSNPITKGIVSAINPATGSDCFNRPLVISGATKVATKSGVSITTNGTSSYAYIALPPTTYTELTAFVVTTPKSLSTSRSVISLGSSSSSNPIFRIATGNTTASKIRIWLRGDNSGTVNTSPDSTNTAFVVGEQSVLAFYAKGSSGPVYCVINGKKDSATTTTMANSWTCDRLAAGAIVFSGGPMEYYDGSSSLLVLYNRELSMAEHASLAANPWQIFL